MRPATDTRDESCERAAISEDSVDSAIVHHAAHTYILENIFDTVPVRGDVCGCVHTARQDDFAAPGAAHGSQPGCRVESRLARHVEARSKLGPNIQARVARVEANRLLDRLRLDPRPARWETLIRAAIGAGGGVVELVLCGENRIRRGVVYMLAQMLGMCGRRGRIEMYV